MWAEFVFFLFLALSVFLLDGSPVFLPPPLKNQFQFHLDRGPTRKPARADVASSLNNLYIWFKTFQASLSLIFLVSSYDTDCH